jgi:glucosamine--fructose-6-phosphate aminotransferase (isomerizing)
MKMLLQQYTEQALKEYIDLMQDKQNMFVLGKGLAYSIALEGALKLKEISYIHAEAFSSSALKHGPLSLIIENTPVFILDIENEYRVKNWNCYEEISARNGNVIYVTNDPLLHVQCIRLEHNNTFGGLLTNTVLQLLSYYIGVRRGNCVDFPRNLAKSVTVY